MYVYCVVSLLSGPFFLKFGNQAISPFSPFFKLFPFY